MGGEGNVKIKIYQTIKNILKNQKEIFIK